MEAGYTGTAPDGASQLKPKMGMLAVFWPLVGAAACRRAWRTFQHDDECPRASSLEFQRLKAASDQVRSGSDRSGLALSVDGVEDCPVLVRSSVRAPPPKEQCSTAISSERATGLWWVFFWTWRFTPPLPRTSIVRRWLFTPESLFHVSSPATSSHGVAETCSNDDVPTYSIDARRSWQDGFALDCGFRMHMASVFACIYVQNVQVDGLTRDCWRSCSRIKAIDESFMTEARLL
ncbi:hypothetical protein J3F83DRAFT_420250 [Trichoderma novae-zelandiae]